MPAAPLTLTRVTHARAWLPRGLAYPDLSVLRPKPRSAFGTVGHRKKQAATYQPMTYISDAPKTSRGYPLAEIDWPFFSLLAGLTYRDCGAGRLPAGARFTLRTREWRRFDFDVIQTGFPAVRLHAKRTSHVVLYFDEALTARHIGVTKVAPVNGLRFELAAGAALDFTAFEPRTLRYLQVLVWQGEAEFADLRLINYANAHPIADGPAGLTAAERLVCRAAVATFRQNALDVFMDCPWREHAGWLLDSLFTARAAWYYCGDNPIERALLENYLRPPRFAGLPRGMVPMCYPAEILHGQFIPNGAIFLGVQLDEAHCDRHLPAAWQPPHRAPRGRPGRLFSQVRE